MASKQAIREKVRGFVAEVLAERGDREDEHIDLIEAEMEELGDAVAQEFATQVLARYGQAGDEAWACPHCGRTLRRAGRRGRELVTTRGAVPIEETKHHCPACRRDFFPSVGPFGIGREV